MYGVYSYLQSWWRVPWLQQKSWRPHIEFTQKYDQKLRTFIKDFKVHGSKIENLNVLLIGLTGCGKSSFYNSCLTAVTNNNRIEKAFSAANWSGTSTVTMRLCKTTIAFANEAAVKLNMFDCQGIHEGKGGISIDRLYDVIEGKIPVGYEFGNSKDDAPPLQNKPRIQDKMHCIVLVINASTGAEKTKWYKTTIDELKRKYIYDKDIQMTILLTHVDRLRGSITEYTDHVFLSTEVRQKVADIAKLFSLSEGDVLPMVNYTDEQRPTLGKDILALFNMLHIMGMANDYVKHIIPMEDFKPTE